MAWHDTVFDVLFPSRRRLEAAIDQALTELEALGKSVQRLGKTGDDSESLEASGHAVRLAVAGLSVSNLHRIRDLVKRRAASRANEITRRIEGVAGRALELTSADRPSADEVRELSTALSGALRDLRDLAAEMLEGSRRTHTLLAAAYLVPIVASYLLGTWLRLGGGLELQEAAALAPPRAYLLEGERFTLEPDFRSRFLSAFADYYFERSTQAFEDYLEPVEPATLETPSPAASRAAAWHRRPALHETFDTRRPGGSVTFVQDEEFVPDFETVDELLELAPEAESDVPIYRPPVLSRPTIPESPQPRDPTLSHSPSGPPRDVLYQDWKLVFRNTSRSQPEFISSIEISTEYVAAEPFPWSELPVAPDVEIQVVETVVRLKVGPVPAVDLRCRVQDDAGLVVRESRLPRLVTGERAGGLVPPPGISNLAVSGGDLASTLYLEVDLSAGLEDLPEGVEPRCRGWYRQLRTVEELCAVTDCSRGRTATAECSYETLVDSTRRLALEAEMVLDDGLVYYREQARLHDSDPCMEPSLRGAMSGADTLGVPLLGIASALIHLDPLAGPPDGSDLIVQRATVDLFGLDEGAGKGQAVSVNRFLNPGGVLVLEIRTRGASNGDYALAVAVNEQLWRHGFEVLAPPREHWSFHDDREHPAELLQRFRAGKTDFSAR